jgi:hypothetical protein
MTAEEEHSPTVALLCLRVSTDGDPSVLTRLLGYFHNLNVTPHRLVAEFGLNHELYVKVDVSGQGPSDCTLSNSEPPG